MRPRKSIHSGEILIQTTSLILIAASLWAVFDWAMGGLQGWFTLVVVLSAAGVTCTSIYLRTSATTYISDRDFKVCPYCTHDLTRVPPLKHEVDCCQCPECGTTVSFDFAKKHWKHVYYPKPEENLEL